MSRIRNIKPGFFQSESLSRLEIPVRMTFAGLWTEADDYGRGVANAKVLCGHLWPFDDDITSNEMEIHLQSLHDTNHIILYEVSEKRYFAIRNWDQHQSASYRRGTSTIPTPPGLLDFDVASANEEPAGAHEPVIYFLRREIDGFIKIGISRNLPNRLADIQTGADKIQLIATVPGDFQVELALHERFSSARAPSGEWFTPTDELVDYITHSILPVDNSDTVVKNHARYVLDIGSGRERKRKEEKGSSRATSVPSELPITDHMRTWLHDEDLEWLDPELETKKFLEWHGAKGTTFKDWTRAWYIWMRKAAEFAMSANGGKRPVNRNPKRKRTEFELTGGGAPRGEFHYEGEPIVLPGEV